MSYRDSETYDPGVGRRSFWYWPSLNSLDESYTVARKSFGGWVFAGMSALGAVAILFTGKDPTDLKTPESSIGGALLGVGIEVLFVLIASYRMRTGRGWIISWLLFASSFSKRSSRSCAAAAWWSAGSSFISLSARPFSPGRAPAGIYDPG
jgi:hypothetical protein